MPIGAATATKLRCMPRQQKANLRGPQQNHKGQIKVSSLAVRSTVARQRGEGNTPKDSMVRPAAEVVPSRSVLTHPSVRMSRATVWPKLSSNLNISFLITSNGLVSAAPATPAATDLAAERFNTCVRCSVVPSGAEGGGKRDATQSFTQMAHTYFGTVFSTEADDP